jgi:hypothetical protein
MSTDDTSINNARIFLLDEDLVRNLFIALKQNTPINLNVLLNVVEAMALNAITERNLFLSLLKSVLVTPSETAAYEKEMERAMTELQDEIHKMSKDVKALKEKDIEESIKKYFEGGTNG